MNAMLKAQRNILSDLKQRIAAATAEFYRSAGLKPRVTRYRFQVKPVGRGVFDIVDSRTGKVVGFKHGHNAACALAHQFEQK